MAKVWKPLGVAAAELCCDITLRNGQCFGWKRHGPDWIGVVGKTVVGLRDTDKGAYFCSHASVDCTDISLAQSLRDYFQLDVSLETLYRSWQKQDDERFIAISKKLPGMRIIRQDPLECLFSFICSSNNNIARITQMLDKLRTRYGTQLLACEKLGMFYSFPTLDTLVLTPEQELRDLGFGYRAKYVVKTAQLLQELGSTEWLGNLRGKPQEKVQEELMRFHGVGRKVADCVALFSLDVTNALPVDTHVWRIACRDYDRDLQSAKSLTPTVYARVGKLFEDRFGEHSGWAHSLVFAAELPQFRTLLPKALQEEMAQFAKHEKRLKQDAKAQKKARLGKSDQSKTPIRSKAPSGARKKARPSRSAVRKKGKVVTTPAAKYSGRKHLRSTKLKIRIRKKRKGASAALDNKK